MGVDADNAPLRDPWVIAAFEGWGDAADASVDAIDHILKIWDGNLLAELDPDEFYDFQFNRPLLDRGFDENLDRSEEHTSELQSRGHLVCRLLLEKKNIIIKRTTDK